MFRSIRVTLLFWYAVILLAALGTLGAVLHRELRSTLYQEADAQLLHWTEAVRLAPDRPPPGLPAGALFAVFDGDGRRLSASPDFPAIDAPSRVEAVTRDHTRWLATPGADGGWIVTGRSVRDENHRIREFLVVLLAAGAGIAALAIAGGYLLFSRALAPARAMTATAERISAKTLSERIDAATVPSELAGLAAALNRSFERLEQAFARQTGFVADASHELRTPLAVLVAHLELAGAEGQSVEQLQQRLAVCREAAARMQTLIAQLLALARADAGEAGIVREPFDLGALATEVANAMRPLANRRNVTIEHDATAVSVSGDRERIGEVATNLVDNAVRYNRDGGLVTVTVAKDGDGAVLRVADTGIGVAAEHRDRIFDRFYRVDPARSRDHGGSGLGLAIARWIVEQHGGSIEVSDGPSGGAEFVVRLPGQPAGDGASSRSR